MVTPMPRQDEGHWFAGALGAHVQLGREAALAAAQGFGRGVAPRGAGGVLVRADDGAVDEVDGPVQVAVGIGLGLQVGEDAVPDALLAPAVVAAGDGAALAVAPRQVVPGRTGAQDPEDAVDDPPMVDARFARLGLLRWEQRLESRPLLVGQVSLCHTAHPSKEYATVCRYALEPSGRAVR